MLLDPEVRLGEAYMDGSLRVEQGTIAYLLAIVLGQTTDGMPPGWARLQWWLLFFYRRLKQLNVPTRAQRNVAHHYDLDGRLYSLFLDADRQYSCAYFESLDQSLDDAQLAKKRHLAAKLVPKEDQRTLDIGCYWGGLALYLAEFCRARVTGITLSREQWQRASERAVKKSLTRSVEFRMADYRYLEEKFDRIVSVGLFEHVDLVFYDAFFGNAPAFWPTTASCCCIPSAAPRGRTSPIPGSPNTSSPAAKSRRCRRCCRRSSDRAFWSPTLKSSGCTTPRRSRRDASVSSPTARRPSASTTGVSCGCGNSTSRSPKWRSANGR